MGIFKRRKQSADERVESAELNSAEADDVQADQEPDLTEPDASADEPETQAQVEARRQRAKLRPRDDVDRSNGPFDASETDTSGFLDFGSLRLQPSGEIELRLDVEEETQTITGVTIMLGQGHAGAVQIQAFAAPKTSGIWYGIRREIMEAILSAGGSADEVEGELGTELHVRMPNEGPDGRVSFSPARFIGVDGPRWFLRAVLSGEAAVDEDVIAQAMDLVRSVAIHRGPEARAPRELLELTIPQELLQQSDANNGANGAPSDPDADARNARIERMERGPEITEIQ